MVLPGKTSLQTSRLSTKPQIMLIWSSELPHSGCLRKAFTSIIESKHFPLWQTSNWVVKWFQPYDKITQTGFNINRNNWFFFNETTAHLLHAIQWQQLPLDELVHLVEHTCEVCCSYWCKQIPKFLTRSLWNKKICNLAGIGHFFLQHHYCIINQ